MAEDHRHLRGCWKFVCYWQVGLSMTAPYWCLMGRIEEKLVDALDNHDV